MADNLMKFAQHATRYDRMQRRFRVFLSVVFGAIACSVVIIALRTKVTPKAPEVQFDRSMMVRVGELSRVFAIRPDPRHPSHLWFAAAEGVYMLDKDNARWRRYGVDRGLPSDWTYDLCLFDGAVWAATTLGPAVLDTQSDTFRPLTRDTVEALSVVNVTDSMVLIYVRGRGLWRYTRATDTAHTVLELPIVKPDRALTCLRCIDGLLYVGTDMEEVYTWDPRSGRTVQIKFPVRFSGQAQVLDIMKWDARLWVATSLDGLYASVTADSVAMVTDYPNKSAFVLCPEGDGFWAGSPWGLWRYHEKQDVWVQLVHVKEHRPGDFQVLALFADSADLWYGSAELGAGYLDKERAKWHPLRAGLSTPNVTAIACSDSAVYTSYGYRGEYIDKFDMRRMQYDHNVNYNDGVGDPYVQSLLFHGSRLYFGAQEAFGYVDLANGRNRYFTRGSPLDAYDIAQIAPDSDGVLLATVFGIVRYAPSTDSLTSYAATSDQRVTCVYPAGDSLWYGTLGRGLKVYDRRRGAVVGTFLEGAPRVVGVAPFERGGRRMLFVATDRAGCFLIDMLSGAQTACPVSADIAGDKSDSSDNEIRCMTRADSLVWIGTEDAGCFVYDPGRNRWGSFTYYNGLLTNQVRSFCDSPRYLFIGCFGGLHRLDKRSAGLHRAVFGSS